MTEPLRAPETPGLYELVSDEQGHRFVAQQPAQPREAAFCVRCNGPHIRGVGHVDGRGIYWSEEVDKME